MTTVSINLLFEEQSHEQAKARDPLKHVIIIGVALVLTAVAVGLLCGQLASRKANELDALRAKVKDLDSAKPVAVGGTDIKAVQAAAVDYLEMNATRSLYGPQLAMIKDVIPDNVQLLAMRFAIVTETIAPPAPAGGAENDAKAARRAKLQTKSIDYLTLVLDATLSSARPELDVDAFIKKLRVEPAFTNYVADVKLKSIARTGTADGKPGSVPTVSFSVECPYREKRGK